ncbi:MAG: hypothetical protein IPK97_17385 [Ahniella sp.]|nr:hypothetical protein [Ahniella sp.]
MVSSSALRRVDSGWGILLLALVLQLPLILNPGYFSHDELQWATQSYLRAFNEIDWINPLDIQTFQYRPLTFNLWMLLSYLFFGMPLLMHGFQALFAAGILLLLYRLMGHYGIAGRHRWLACLLWLCVPYVVYVNGWVGTFGDQIWLAAGIGMLISCFRTDTNTSHIRPLLAGFAATWIGLLAKESALVIPAFLLAHAVLFAEHRRIFVWATIGASLGAGIYLALRLKIILAGAEASGAYQPTWFDMPVRIAEYWTYPATLQRLEPFGVFLDKSSRVNWSLGTLLLATLALLVTRWRHLVAVVILSAIALGPTLVLAYTAPQYAYGFSAVVVVVLAHASRSMPKWALFMVLPWVALTATHGVHVLQALHAAGQVQSVCCPR